MFNWTHAVIGIVCFLIGFFMCAFFTFAKVEDTRNENLELKNKLKKYVVQEINHYIN